VGGGKRSQGSGEREDTPALNEKQRGGVFNEERSSYIRRFSKIRKLKRTTPRLEKGKLVGREL